MRRRDFIAGPALAAGTGRVRAQQTERVYRIAVGDPLLPLAGLSEGGENVFYDSLFTNSTVGLYRGC